MAGPSLESRRISRLEHRGGKMMTDGSIVNVTGETPEMARGFHIVQEADGTWACQIVEQHPIDTINAVRTMLDAASHVISDHMAGPECVQKVRDTLADCRRVAILKYQYLGEQDALHLTRFQIEDLHALVTVFLARWRDAEATREAAHE